MKPTDSARCAHALWLCLLAALPMFGPQAHAQTDPTRPPWNAGARSPGAAQSPTPNPAGTPAATPPAVAREPQAPVAAYALVSAVLIGPDRTASAVINGRVVRVGDKFEDATVVAIDASGVRLHSPKGRIHLGLWSRVAPTASANPQKGMP